VQLLAGYQFRDAGTPPTSRHHWLRGDIGAVNNQTPHFISIVNCSGWIALRSTYKDCSTYLLKILWDATITMSATSGDDTERTSTHAAITASAIRSLAMSGNRIDSRELFSNDREIIIAHGEEAYRLRLTSQNKLILTK
jgi:hemin uptake protein HemP